MKRILSILTACAMTATMLPAPALAQGASPEMRLGVFQKIGGEENNQSEGTPQAEEVQPSEQTPQTVETPRTEEPQQPAAAPVQEADDAEPAPSVQSDDENTGSNSTKSVTVTNAAELAAAVKDSSIKQIDVDGDLWFSQALTLNEGTVLNVLPTAFLGIEGSLTVPKGAALNILLDNDSGSCGQVYVNGEDAALTVNGTLNNNGVLNVCAGTITIADGSYRPGEYAFVAAEAFTGYTISGIDASSVSLDCAIPIGESLSDAVEKLAAVTQCAGKSIYIYNDTDVEAGRTFVLDKSVTIPADMSLIIQDGVVLKVTDKAALTVYGFLSFYNAGLTVDSGSTVSTNSLYLSNSKADVYGTLSVAADSCTLHGTCTVTKYTGADVTGVPADRITDGGSGTGSGSGSSTDTDGGNVTVSVTPVSVTSEEELRAALTQKNTNINITGSVCLTANITIPADYTVTVTPGAGLTVPKGFVLTVPEKASLVIDSDVVPATAGAGDRVGSLYLLGTLTVSGTLSSRGQITVDGGKLTVPAKNFLNDHSSVCVIANADFSVSGVDAKNIDVVYPVNAADADGLRKAANKLGSMSGYKSRTVTAEDVTVLQSATVPKGVTLQISGTLTVPASTTLTVDGNALLSANSTMEVYGKLTVSSSGSLVKDSTAVLRRYTGATVKGVAESLITDAVVPPSSVSSENDLIEAIRSGSKEITVSGSMTLKTLLTIPSGCTVSVKPGVTLTVTGTTLKVASGGTLKLLSDTSILNFIDASLLCFGSLHNAGIIILNKGSLSVSSTLYYVRGGKLSVNATEDFTLSGFDNSPADYTYNYTVNDSRTLSEVVTLLNGLTGYRSRQLILSGDVTLSQALSVPAGVRVSYDDGTLTVPAGITLTVPDSLTLGSNAAVKVLGTLKAAQNSNTLLTLSGSLNIAASGSVSANTLQNDGTAAVYGKLAVSGSYRQNDTQKRISCYEPTGSVSGVDAAYIETVKDITNVTTYNELVQALSENKTDIHITQSIRIDAYPGITLPANCTLTIDSGVSLAVPSGCGLTVPFGAVLVNNGTLRVSGIAALSSGCYQGTGSVIATNTLDISGIPMDCLAVSYSLSDDFLTSELVEQLNRLSAAESIVLSLSGSVAVDTTVTLKDGIDVTVSGTLTVPKGVTLNVGKLSAANTGSLNVGGTLNGKDCSLSGYTVVERNGTLSVSGTLTAAGAAHVYGSLKAAAFTAASPAPAFFVYPGATVSSTIAEAYIHKQDGSAWYVLTEAQLRDAIDAGVKKIFLCTTFQLTQNLVVPENCSIVAANTFIVEQDVSLSLSDGSSLTTQGSAYFYGQVYIDKTAAVTAEDSLYVNGAAIDVNGTLTVQSFSYGYRPSVINRYPDAVISGIPTQYVTECTVKVTKVSTEQQLREAIAAGKRNIAVIGSFTLSQDLTLPKKCSVTLESTLTVPKGITLLAQKGAVLSIAYNAGILISGGALLVEGTLANGGFIDVTSGTLRAVENAYQPTADGDVYAHEVCTISGISGENTFAEYTIGAANNSSQQLADAAKYLTELNFESTTLILNDTVPAQTLQHHISVPGDLIAYCDIEVPTGYNLSVGGSLVLYGVLTVHGTVTADTLSVNDELTIAPGGTVKVNTLQNYDTVHVYGYLKTDSYETTDPFAPLYLYPIGSIETVDEAYITRIAPAADVITTEAALQEAIKNGQTDITVSGDMHLTANLTVPSGVKLTITGGFTVPKGVTLTLDNAQLSVTGSGILINHGDIVVKNGSSLEIDGSFTNNGNIRVEDSTLQVAETFTNNGTLVAADSTLTFKDVVNNGTLAANGTRTGYTSTCNVTVSGELTNNGLLSLSGSHLYANTLINNGSIGTWDAALEADSYTHNGVLVDGYFSADSVFSSAVAPYVTDGVLVSSEADIAGALDAWENLAVPTPMTLIAVCDITLLDDLTIPEGVTLSTDNILTVSGCTLTVEGTLEAARLINCGIVAAYGTVAVTPNATNSNYTHGSGAVLEVYDGAVVTGINEAFFTYKTYYNLAVAVGIPHGAVSLSHLTATPGTEITITALPGTGYGVVSYTVNGVAQTANTFVMPACDVYVSASFQALTYDVVLKQPENGTVYASKLNALPGDTVYITATPNSGYALESYLVDGVEQTENTFTMPTGRVTVSAKFRPLRYSITAVDGEHMTLTVSDTSAAVGSTVTVTATPDTGYRVDKIYVNGAAITGTTFLMPAEEVLVTATAMPKSYFVTLETPAHGTLTASATTAQAGDNVILTAKPDTGYALQYLLVNGVVSKNTTFVMPAQNVTVKAVFAVSADALRYTWNAKKGCLVITNGTKTLTEGTDYTVVISSCTPDSLTCDITFLGEYAHLGTICRTFYVDLSASVNPTVLTVPFASLPSGVSVDLSKTSVTADGELFSAAGLKAVVQDAAEMLQLTSTAAKDILVTLRADIGFTAAELSGSDLHALTVHLSYSANVVFTDKTTGTVQSANVPVSGDLLSGEAFRIVLPTGGMTPVQAMRTTADTQNTVFAESTEAAAKASPDEAFFFTNNTVITYLTQPCTLRMSTAYESDIIKDDRYAPFTVTVNGQERTTAAEGEVLTLNAAAVAGYTPLFYLDGSSTPISGNTCTMPDHSISIACIYKPLSYDITTVCDAASGTMTVTVGGTAVTKADCDALVTVSVTAKSGLRCSQVSVVGENDEAVTVTAEKNGTYTFYMPAGSVTVSAQFSTGGYPIVGLTDAEAQMRLYVDGMPVTTYLDTLKTTYLTGFTYAVGSNGLEYPDTMKVWKLTPDGNTLKATDLKLDDLLKYAGCSIRIAGVQGIRVFTSIDEGLRSQILSKGIDGYTVTEYGTVVSWASQNTNPTVGGIGCMTGYAYNRAANKTYTYATQNGRVIFTNVLTFGNDYAKCKPQLCVRPYIQLSDASGNTVYLYGGTLTRSIRDIALQLQSSYLPGSTIRNYLDKIISETE